MLNAGALHRIGPNRLHVELARQLACAGFLCCRFDLSGIGDSRATGSEEHFWERWKGEVRAVMDRLQESHGARRFALFGLCSGTELALECALCDPRVYACVLVNGALVAGASASALDSARTHTRLRYYARRILDGKSLLRLLTFQSNYRAIGVTLVGLLRRAFEQAARPVPGDGMDLSRLTRLVERGVALLLLYSEGSPYLDVCRGQLTNLVASLGRQGRPVMADVLAAADHVFTLQWARDWLIERVERELCRGILAGTATVRAGDA